MKARQDAILLFSSNYQLKDLLRYKLHKLKDDVVLLNKNSIENLGDFNIRLTIIDENQDFELLRTIVTNNTAVIIKEKSLVNFEHILEYNINHILEIPINENLLCAIIYKSLGMLKDKCPQFVLFHNLKLCLSQNYLVFNETKIGLTQTEATIMYDLMTKQSIKPEKGTLNEKYLQVTIFRINKKFKESLNMKLVRSKYGVGYYLAI